MFAIRAVSSGKNEFQSPVLEAISEKGFRNPIQDTSRNLSTRIIKIDLMKHCSL
jgi:hypothetical protein